jgi:sorting nexin-25
MGLEKKDVITAGLGALVSWLLLTHWVPSFRWIPYAFVTGCLATLVGLALLLLTSSKGPDHRYNHATTIRPPAFVTPALWKQEKAALKSRSRYDKTPIYPSSANVSLSIDGLLDFVLRDFITTWCKNISLRPLFQNEVDRAIRQVLDNVRKRTQQLDMVELGVARIVPILTNHMRDFYNAERIVRGKNLSRDMTESEELDLAIAAKFRDGKLHPAAALAFSDTKLLQQTHLRRLISKILPLVMPEYMKTSAAVTTLVKEIVACAVLTPVVLMLSDPDFFNQLIENSGRTMLQDRKSVRKLRAALDEHAVPTPQHPKAGQFPRLRPNDNERQFERFIRATRNCATLSDARRFRSEISSQLRKATAGPEQDPIYLRRLESGRRILDQKIAHFTAGGTSRPKLTVKASASSVEQTSRLSQASLDEVLHSASGLSYFMEFMDRKGRMRLVQFWIVVDGFRNPLEADNDEPEQELQDTPWTPSDRMDLEQMYEAYLTKPELTVPDHDRQAVRDFLRAGRSADIRLYVSARRAVLRAQTSVFEEMKEHHFDNFRKSDLFYKWLATEESSIMSAASEGHPELSRSLSVGGERDRPLHREARPAAVLSPKSPRAPELRRPAMSSSDLKSFIKPSVVASPVRQSIDGGRPRPLFDDEVEDERMTRSVSALSSMDLDIESDLPQDNSAQVVDAMQAALNEIMDEPDSGLILSTDNLVTSNDSPRNSLDGARPTLAQTRSKPSIASLGLVGAVSSKGVFEDDLFGEEEKFAEDEKEDSDLMDKSIEDDIHEAAPGDLGLTEAISTLNADIDRLTAQDAILDSLTKKAELTNNAAELRILRKSKQSLAREIHRKEMQKQQYTIQESDNSLYGRAAVNIKSIMVGREEDGHEFALCKYHVFLFSRGTANGLQMSSKLDARQEIRCLLQFGW